ncbi:YktB family protein [Schinkia sp. CFF1]
MNFTGFSKKDFEIFYVAGLDERMELIRTFIQPKFQEIGNILVDELQMELGNEMYLHIAKHARRTVNPPKDTWLAIADNKRGYKKHPHFQVGLFDDHVFVWLAFIYELPRKAEIGQALLKSIDLLEKIPANFVISLDHTERESFSAQNMAEVVKGLERFRDTKKGEFLIGRHFEANDPLLQNGDEFVNIVKDTFKTLIPIYKVSMSA